MKKGLIFTVLLMSVLVFGFSQTNSWTVTNSSTWIEAVNGIRSGGNDKTYTITVTGTVSIPGSAESTFGAVTGITVNMEGSGTLSLSNNGALLNIGAKQTVIVRDVTLRGRSDNPSSVVENKGGTFRMEGNASVTGNTGGGGVWVNGGTFTMQDSASVTGNSRSNGNNGGGVTVDNGGTFTMQSGTISNNTVSRRFENGGKGGGVANKGTFTMNGGTISGNTANVAPYSDGGGGVYNQNTFTMQGGTISGNTVVGYGGGVCNSGAFTMQGGTISNNTSTMASGGGGGNGGGVYTDRTFTMQGGTISGNTVVGSGGGVLVESGTFTMQGNAEVSGNTARGYGGGVRVYGRSFLGSKDSATFTMQGNAVVSGNTADSGGGVLVDERGTFAMQGDATISGNTATFRGGGVLCLGGGTFNKTGGTIYGEDAEPNQRNTVISRFGNAVYESKNGGWRNVTAGPTMNPSSYGFWLNDGDVVTLPSGFEGTWKRSNFNNTLALSSNLIKSSSSDRFWILQRVSGNSYTFKRADATNIITLTMSLTDGNLVISGDSGSGQDNWNGTWRRQ